MHTKINKKFRVCQNENQKENDNKRDEDFSKGWQEHTWDSNCGY